MKRIVLCVASFIVCFAMVASVFGIEPSRLEITERDKEIYSDAKAGSTKRENKLSVAILVMGGDTEKSKKVAKALDASLNSTLSDFAFFQVVERGNLEALLKESELESLGDSDLAQIKIPSADYLITASVSSVRIEKKGQGGLFGALNKDAKAGYKATVGVDFRFYEKSSQRTIFTKNLEKNAPGLLYDKSGSAAISKLAEAAQECAKAFGLELGSRYAPVARVLETRGDGRVAKISIGTNYGVAKGMKVDVFVYVDDSDVIKDATREPSVIATGYVISSTKNRAWVDVDDYKKAKVLRGHYARLAPDQSKGFKTSIKRLFK